MKFLAKKIVSFYRYFFEYNILGFYVYHFTGKLLDIPVLLRMARYLWRKSYGNKPQMLGIHISSLCNLRCRYCYSYRDIEDIKIEQWLEIVKEAKNKLDVESILLLGGEPTLHKQLFWFLNELDKLNLNVVISSNGTLIDDHFISQLRLLRKKPRFYINFDHHKIYSEITGAKENGYETVFNNILRLKKNRYFVSIFITVTKLNYDYVEEFMLMLRKHRVRFIIERCLPVNDYTKGVEITSKEWSDLVFRLYDKKIIPVPNRILGKITGSCCQNYDRIMFITTHGNVLPCSFAPEDLTIGNILNEKIESIWERYKSLRNQWHILPEECSDCKYRFECGGGCRTHAYLKYKNFKMKDPLCDIEYKIPPTVFGL
ncbi:MAG: radical SAM protein [Candidatus Aureabacteria bacterium]|nr:radical SAM protein [Candidatus Auribacterota bacterium]